MLFLTALSKSAHLPAPLGRPSQRRITIPGVLWHSPLTMLRLLLLLLCSELVRTGLMVSVLPLAAPGLHLSPGLVGLMVGVHYLMDALGKGPMGLVQERYGLGRVLLLGSLLGLGVLLGLYLLGGSPVWAVLGCALWGLAYAALWPGVMSASQTLAVPGRTARALAVSNLSVAPAILGGVLLYAVYTGSLLLTQRLETLSASREEAHTDSVCNAAEIGRAPIPALHARRDVFLPLALVMNRLSS